MRQILKIENDIKNINKNIKSNNEKIDELYIQLRRVKQGIYKRKMRNKKYDDLTAARLDIRNNIKHYKNDTVVLENRLIEFINLKNNILLKKCVICNIDIHRASYNKHLISKKHLENIKQNEMIIPEWFFQEPVENKIKKNI